MLERKMKNGNVKRTVGEWLRGVFRKGLFNEGIFQQSPE